MLRDADEVLINDGGRIPTHPRFYRELSVGDRSLQQNQSRASSAITNANRVLLVLCSHDVAIQEAPGGMPKPDRRIGVFEE